MLDLRKRRDKIATDLKRSRQGPISSSHHFDYFNKPIEVLQTVKNPINQPNFQEDLGFLEQNTKHILTEADENPICTSPFRPKNVPK